MILSASRRTDIPARYADWFMNRIRAGYVLTRNPMNRAQLSKIQLTPDKIDCIVFWTKDAAPMLSCLDELDLRGYSYYFQHTLTPYARDYEKNLRDKREIITDFRRLAERVGRERLVWRYDPIIVNEHVSVGWHKRAFARLCELLADAADTVVISFVDQYAKIKSPLIRPLTGAEMDELAAFIGETAASYGLRAAACSEAGDFTQYGIERSACIDARRIERITGRKLALAADKNQRSGCGCAASVDIGAYNTCPNGCIYCYANYSDTVVAKSIAAHNPAGELLCDQIRPGEIPKLRS